MPPDLTQAVFHSCPAAIAEVGPDGRITSWNPTFERWFGRPERPFPELFPELTGDSPAEIYHQASQAWYQAVRSQHRWCWTEVTQRRRLETLARFQEKAGGLLGRGEPVESVLRELELASGWGRARLAWGAADPGEGDTILLRSPIRAGDRGPGEVQLTGPDRPFDAELAAMLVEAASAQLAPHLAYAGRARASWLNGLLRAVPEAVLGVDPEGRITLWNPSAERLLESTAADLEGAPLTHAFQFELEDGEPAEPCVMQTLRGGGRADCDEHWLLTPSGRKAVAECSTPIVDAEGELAGAALALREVGEARQAMQRLRAREHYYRRLVETTGEGVWMVDADYRTTYVNQRTCEMLNVSADELLGAPLYDFLFPEDLPYFREVQSRCHQGLPEPHDMRYRRRDGSEIWLRTSASSVMSDQGEFLAGFALLTDITESRREEESLARSEARIRTVVQAISQAVWIADSTGKTLGPSTGWEELTGMALPDRWTEALHPAERAEVEAAWEDSLRAATPFERETRVDTPAGEKRWLHVRAVPVGHEAGAAAEWVLAATDVTEEVSNRRRLEEEARLAAFQAEVHDIVASFDALADVLAHCVASAEKHLGWTGVQVWWRDASGELRLEASGGEQHAIEREPGSPQAIPGRVVREGRIGDPTRPDAVVVTCGPEPAPTLERELEELASALFIWISRRSSEDEQQRLLRDEQAARLQAQTFLEVFDQVYREETLEGALRKILHAGLVLTRARAVAFEPAPECRAPSVVVPESRARLSSEAEAHTPVVDSGGERLGTLYFAEPGEMAGRLADSLAAQAAFILQQPRFRARA